MIREGMERDGRNDNQNRRAGGKAEDRVELCSPCHKQIHAIFDNRHLEANFSDIDALRRDPQRAQAH